MIWRAGQTNNVFVADQAGQETHGIHPKIVLLNSGTFMIITTEVNKIHRHPAMTYGYLLVGVRTHRSIEPRSRRGKRLDSFGYTHSSPGEGGNGR